MSGVLCRRSVCVCLTRHVSHVLCWAFYAPSVVAFAALLFVAGHAHVVTTACSCRATLTADDFAAQFCVGLAERRTCAHARPIALVSPCYVHGGAQFCMG